MNYLPKVLIVAAMAATAYAGSLAWRAHSKLVTLHVRNAPVAKVVSKLRWQTWETFVANTNVTGAITLDVDRMPLERVLSIIGEQLNARWTSVYPIYRDKIALVSLGRALRGEADLANTGFTTEGGPGMGFRSEPPGAEPRLVTLHLTNTDLTISALALGRFGGGQVLVEKSANAPVNLELANLSLEKAVATVAQSTHRKTTHLYSLQPGRGPGMMAAGRGGDRERPDRAPADGEADARRAEKMQQVLQALPEDEQKKAEERQAERTAMQSLTPEQRQQLMADRMNSPEMQARADQRAASNIKNTTPEQRRDRFERMYEMRKARAARNG